MFGQPQVQFRPNDFNAAIWAHGYDIICEQAVRCPCQGTAGAPHSDCQNCHGFGYIFVNPYKTKALITGLNRNTQYVQWSPELIGTAAITVRDEDKDHITYFSRVTVADERAVFSEAILARDMGGGAVAAFTSYAPIEIVSVWKYSAPDAPLVRLGAGNYGISANNPYCIEFFNNSVGADVMVSLLYKHRVEYHIVDLPHEIRASLGRNKKSGQFEILKMPIQGIGRRTHLIDIKRPDYDGTGVIINDYTE